MRRLKVNYFSINISLAIILFAFSKLPPQTELNIAGQILSLAIFIYGISGLIISVYFKKCMICSRRFFSSKYEICPTCHTKIQQKLSSKKAYSIEYPQSSRERFNNSKSNSPSTESSPVSRFIE